MKYLSVSAGFLAYLLAGLVFCVAVAEQPADPQGDRARELHKELAGTRGNDPASIVDKKPPITFKPAPSPVFSVGPILDCQHGAHPKLVIGNDVIVIDECTGTVVLNNSNVDASSLKFWQAVQRAWPMVCATPAKTK